MKIFLVVPGIKKTAACTGSGRVEGVCVYPNPNPTFSVMAIMWICTGQVVRFRAVNVASCIPGQLVRARSRQYSFEVTSLTHHSSGWLR